MNVEDFISCEILSEQITGITREGDYHPHSLDLKKALRLQGLDPDHLDFMLAAELMAQNIQCVASENLRRGLVEYVVTKDSHFFRNKPTFEHFRRRELPRILQSHRERKRVKIWSAATSHGQEAYSIALLLPEGLEGWDIKVLATDISETSIKFAQKGTYPTSHFDLRNVARYSQYLAINKSVTQATVTPALKEKVDFRVFNLLGDPQNLLHATGDNQPFDIIFCRHVLMHLNPEANERVVENVVSVLADGGVIYTGNLDSDRNTNLLSKFCYPRKISAKGGFYWRKKPNALIR